MPKKPLTEEQKAKQLENQRKLYAEDPEFRAMRIEGAKKTYANLSPEEKKAYNQRSAERRKAKRAAETPEERAARLEAKKGENAKTRERIAATETPEERAARLEAKRLSEARRREAKKLSAMVPDPSTLPLPPMGEEEWNLTAAKELASPKVAEAERVITTAFNVAAAQPPPTPRPTTAAVRHVGIGAGVPPPKVDKRAAKKAEKLAAFKENYIQMEKRIAELPLYSVGVEKTRRETRRAYEKTGSNKFNLTDEDFKALREEFRARYGAEIDALHKAQRDQKDAELAKAQQTYGYVGTWGLAFHMAKYGGGGKQF